MHNSVEQDNPNTIALFFSLVLITMALFLSFFCFLTAQCLLTFGLCVPGLMVLWKSRTTCTLTAYSHYPQAKKCSILPWSQVPFKLHIDGAVQCAVSAHNTILILSLQINVHFYSNLHKAVQCFAVFCSAIQFTAEKTACGAGTESRKCAAESSMKNDWKNTFYIHLI